MKIIKYLNVLGRDSTHALIPLEKRNPVAVAANPLAVAGISAGASLLGNVLGFGSQKLANETNFEIAKYNAAAQRLQNEQNYWYSQQLMNEQNAFSERMTKEARDYNEQYNDPKNVVARLKAAGINPAFAYGSAYQANASGVSSTSPSFNGVAPQLTYQHQPFFPDFSGVGQAVNAYFQNEMLNRQSESVSVDTQIKKVELMYKAQKEIGDLYEQRARIGNLIAQEKVGSAQYDNLVSQKHDLDNRIRLFEDTFDELKKREKLQNDVMSEQKQNLISDTALKRSQTWLNQINAQWFPKMQKAQIDLITEQQMQVVENVALMVAERRLTNKKAIEQAIINGIKGLEYQDESIKHGIRHGNNQGTKTLYYFTDYISSLLLGNLKLFGK